MTLHPVPLSTNKMLFTLIYASYSSLDTRLGGFRSHAPCAHFDIPEHADPPSRGFAIGHARRWTEHGHCSHVRPRGMQIHGSTRKCDCKQCLGSAHPPRHPTHACAAATPFSRACRRKTTAVAPATEPTAWSCPSPARTRSPTLRSD